LEKRGRQQLTGVVLAGGANRRMGGQPKAHLELDGRKFIERQLDQMSTLCSEVLIIANEPELFAGQLQEPEPAIRVIRDLQPGSGPLAGIQAAMAQAVTEELWVVACDMPFVSAAAAETLLELRRSGDRDAAVPLLSGQLQPLHAVYHRRSRSVIDELLECGRFKVMEWLNRLDYAAAEERIFTELGIPTGFAVNVNTPAELQRLN
jgi:molybdopterin-guanine dinucleotide biosynthesis protein A